MSAACWIDTSSPGVEMHTLHAGPGTIRIARPSGHDVTWELEVSLNGIRLLNFVSHQPVCREPRFVKPESVAIARAALVRAIEDACTDDPNRRSLRRFDDAIMELVQAEIARDLSGYYNIQPEPASVAHKKRSPWHRRQELEVVFNAGAMLYLDDPADWLVKELEAFGSGLKKDWLFDAAPMFMVSGDPGALPYFTGPDAVALASQAPEELPRAVGGPTALGKDWAVDRQVIRATIRYVHDNGFAFEVSDATLSYLDESQLHDIREAALDAVMDGKKGDHFVVFVADRDQKVEFRPIEQLAHETVSFQTAGPVKITGDLGGPQKMRIYDMDTGGVVWEGELRSGESRELSRKRR